VFVGMATVDLVQRVERPPEPNEKLTALSQEVAAGGPAANAAVAFARLGGSATVITALGNHPLARYVAEELARHGVTVLDAASEATIAPAVSSILVTQATGERQVVSRNAGRFWGEHPPAPPSTWPDADVVLVDGHFPSLASGAAKAIDAPVVLDGGSWKPALPELLPSVGYAVCSADFRPPTGAPEAFLRAAGVPWVAVTHGPEPVEWWGPEAGGQVRVPSVAVQDTLGAGDAFHGAFAYALVNGFQFADALAFGAEVAARRCATAGPRAWLADSALDALAASVRSA
jgi:sugar/nucleoside kinase (ribokinase family)